MSDTTVDKSVKTVEKITPVEFSMYKVILHNDDKTPMELVTQILTEIFQKDLPEAMELMLRIHNLGSGVAGIYTYEIAEEKADETMAIARQFGYPLMATVEKE